MSGSGRLLGWWMVGLVNGLWMDFLMDGCVGGLLVWWMFGLVSGWSGGWLAS